MLEMFHVDLLMVINSSDNPATTMVERMGRAFRTEYYLTQTKEEQTKYFKSKKNQKGL